MNIGNIPLPELAYHLLAAIGAFVVLWAVACVIYAMIGGEK